MEPQLNKIAPSYIFVDSMFTTALSELLKTIFCIIKKLEVLLGEGYLTTVFPKLSVKVIKGPTTQWNLWPDIV